MRAVAPQRIGVLASRQLLLIQSVAHLVAVVAVWLSNLPALLSATLMLVIGASLAVQRRPQSVIGLILGGDGALEKVDAEGTAIRVMLAPQTLVLPFLVILLWREGRRHCSLPVMRDSMSADDFHTLRLWLRWQSTAIP
jgi:hypothetical protein